MVVNPPQVSRRITFKVILQRKGRIELSVMLEAKESSRELVVSGCSEASLPWSESLPESLYGICMLCSPDLLWQCLNLHIWILIARKLVER